MYPVMGLVWFGAGHVFPEVNEGAIDKPFTYQFYAGIELHPRQVILVFLKFKISLFLLGNHSKG